MSEYMNIEEVAAMVQKGGPKGAGRSCDPGYLAKFPLQLGSRRRAASKGRRQASKFEIRDFGDLA